MGGTFSVRDPEPQTDRRAESLRLLLGRLAHLVLISRQNLQRTQNFLVPKKKI